MEDDPKLSWEKDRSVEALMSSAQALAVLAKDDTRARTYLKGYVKFLLADKEDRDYTDLSRFLAWYGETYVLQDIHTFICDKSLDQKYQSVVEFGPGTGWLIGGIAHLFKNAYAVDKRTYLIKPQEGVTFILKDLEEEAAGQPFSDCVVVANHFIHCVDDIPALLGKYSAPAWVVIEPTFGESIFPYWGRQMKDFGATPHRWGEIINLYQAAGYVFCGAKLTRGQQIGLFEKV